MSRTTASGLGILGGALVLGIVMDGLLQPAMPGLNVILCLLALIAAITILTRRKREAVAGEGRWLLLPALFFGAAFAWRDSPTLQLVNGLGLATALALAALRMRSGRISGAGIADYLLGVMVAVVQAAAGHFPLLFREIQWKEVPRGRWYGTLFGIGRGVAIAAPLLLLFGGLFASAVQRMLLYQDAYGMTELRFYTTAFMGWVAVLALWFLGTVLRGQRERFAFGALVTAFVAIAVLDRVNPDAFIVRTNVARVEAGRSLDTQYLTSLSADAVPTLVEALPVLDEAKRHAVAKMVLTRWSPPAERDWRAWNWDRTRAWRAVGEYQACLRRPAPAGKEALALASARSDP